MGTNYVLGYGFRRYAACKKLGLQNVDCYDKYTGESVNLRLEDIKVLDKKNTRLDEDSEEFNALMASIKANGLLEPLGVYKEEDVNKTDFLINNITENVVRKDITPLELSLAIRQLMKLGLSAGQVAVRLGVPTAKVHSMIRASSSMDDETLKQADFIGSNLKAKKGKLPFTILNNIMSNHYTRPKDKKELVEIAKKEELSTRDTDLMCRIMRVGATASEAFKKKDKYIRLQKDFIINKKELKKYKHKATKVIEKILTGRLPPNKKLFMFK